MNGDEWEKFGRRQRLKLQPLQQSCGETPSSPSTIHRSSEASDSSPSSWSTADNTRKCSLTARDRDGLDVSRDDVRSKSMAKATLNALLDLDRVGLGGATVEKFVSSVREPEIATNNADEEADRRLPPLTAMMHLLSMQQTPSYRPPRVAVLRRLPVARKRPSRKKVSTLALINKHERRFVK
jgi:hypothetical protein